MAAKEMTKKSFYRSNESKVHGVAACRALFQRRPGDLIKVYVSKKLSREFGDVLKWCAQHRKAYKIVGDDELEKLTASVHHEGVCFLAKEPSLPRPEETVKLLEKEPSACVLILDGVGNPHNVGNVLRSAAHFGVKAVFIADDNFTSVPSSTRRVSEGGSEFINVVSVQNMTPILTRLKKCGFAIFGTSSHAAKSVYMAKIPSRCVFVLGEESWGISPSVAAICDENLIIPGTQNVESLNIASAAAVLMSEYARRFPTGG